MDLVKTVDTGAADGGLEQVLKLANVHDLLKAAIKEEGVMNLMEFTLLFSSEGYEAEAKVLRDKVESLKTKQIEVARLKAAIFMGRGVIQRPVGEKVAQASPADMEAPLDPMEKASMAEAWTKRYGVALTMWMDPA